MPKKPPDAAHLSALRAAAGRLGGSVKSKRKADAARKNLNGNRKGPKPKPEHELSRSALWRRKKATAQPEPVRSSDEDANDRKEQPWAPWNPYKE